MDSLSILLYWNKEKKKKKKKKKLKMEMEMERRIADHTKHKDWSLHLEESWGRTRKKKKRRR